MKYLKHIPAYFLSLIYLVFGSNYWLKFIEMPPMQGDSGNFIGLLYSTGYLAVVKALEVLFAIVLLVPKTRALGFLIIAPITINILLFELCIEKHIGIALLLVILNAAGIVLNKEKYYSIIK